MIEEGYVRGDEVDLASAREEMAREEAMARIRAQLTNPGEDPDEDAEGNRYCLDCGEIIPQGRVVAVNAVRCVECATRLERGKPRRSVALAGGIRRYLRPESGDDTPVESLSDIPYPED